MLRQCSWSCKSLNVCVAAALLEIPLVRLWLRLIPRLLSYLNSLFEKNYHTLPPQAPVNERLAEAKARAQRRETQPGLFRWAYETQPGLRAYLDALMDLGAGAEASRAGRMGRGLPMPRVAREAPGVGLAREGGGTARVVIAQVGPCRICGVLFPWTSLAAVFS